MSCLPEAGGLNPVRKITFYVVRMIDVVKSRFRSRRRITGTIVFARMFIYSCAHVVFVYRDRGTNRVEMPGTS